MLPACRLMFARLSVAVLTAAAVLPTPGTAATAASVPKLPEIRTSASNNVPRCVTPERLMAFLKTRNPGLNPRFNGIAQWYRHYGDAWRVRWDYAFFQMALETNFLSYRRPNGKMGDVDPAQNNFAGIGTTGGGVPGDSFPDVKTGVLGQIQHLVAYSGERLANPVAPRTALKQDHIIAASSALGRPVRFSDLARRWAADPKYASSIAYVTDLYRQQHCQHPEPVPTEKPIRAAGTATAPAEARPVPRGSAGVSREARCTIHTASYGGRRTVLLRHDTGGGTALTALTVLEGFEKSMTESFIKTRSPGARTVGVFETNADALAKAREICPKV